MKCYIKVSGYPRFEISPSDRFTLKNILTAFT